jgi:hypothetical protein
VRDDGALALSGAGRAQTAALQMNGAKWGSARVLPCGLVVPAHRRAGEVVARGPVECRARRPGRVCRIDAPECSRSQRVMRLLRRPPSNSVVAADNRPASLRSAPAAEPQTLDRRRSRRRRRHPTLRTRCSEARSGRLGFESHAIIREAHFAFEASLHRMHDFVRVVHDATG